MTCLSTHCLEWDSMFLIQIATANHWVIFCNGTIDCPMTSLISLWPSWTCPKASSIFFPFSCSIVRSSYWFPCAMNSNDVPSVVNRWNIVQFGLACCFTLNLQSFWTFPHLVYHHTGEFYWSQQKCHVHFDHLVLMQWVYVAGFLEILESFPNCKHSVPFSFHHGHKKTQV